MKHSIVALSALFAAVQADVFLTNTNFNVKPNEMFTITYNDGGCFAPGCTIELKSGPRGDLKTVKVLTTAATGTSFSFTPTQDWPSGPLAFEIRNTIGGQNYSPQFPYAGTGSAASPGTSSAVASNYPGVSTAPGISDMTSTSATATESTAATPYGLGHLNNSSSITTSRSSTARNTTTGVSSPSSTSFPGEESVPTVTSSGDRVSASLALAAGVFAALAYLN